MGDLRNKSVLPIQCVKHCTAEGRECDINFYFDNKNEIDELSQCATHVIADSLKLEIVKILGVYCEIPSNRISTSMSIRQKLS